MDRIFYNGNFVTMDEDNPTAQAVAVQDGKFAFVGGNEAALKLRTDATELVDLRGATAYPGLIDSHLHILNLAVTNRELILGDCRTRQGLFETVKAGVANAKMEGIIDGRGFNEDLWDEKKLPTREELDAIAPNRALRLTRVCGHLAVANSKLLEEMGIDENTKVPEGGDMNLKKGWFMENALNLLYRDEGDPGVELCKELLCEGMAVAADAGLTTIYSDDFGTYGYSFATVAQAYRELDAEGKMPVRVVQQCAFPDKEGFDAFFSAGFAYFQGDDFYRIGPRKLYADGSLGARTAWLTIPYADAPEKSGVPIYTQDELNALAADSHRRKMPFIVHAIGDKAVESVLSAVEYARQAVPDTENLPDGVVHCQITSEHTLKRIAELGVQVYAQPVFAEYDLHICRDRVGERLEATSYNWKTLMDYGVNLSSGSDCPVESLSPAGNLYCAVTRKDYDGCPENGWLPEQKLSVHQALLGHTVNAAKAVGLQGKIGCIKAGLLADLSVFPKDFASLAPEEILHQQPIMTLVSGNCRRSKHQ